MARHLTAADTTTHVAACPVQIGKRIIQRCLVCGDKLADNASVDAYKFWEEGELVLAKLGFFSGTGGSYSAVDSTKDLPKNFCLRLVEM